MTEKAINNGISQMTATDYPIIQAPMGWIPGLNWLPLSAMRGLAARYVG